MNSLKNLENTLAINGSCFYNLLRSAVEDAPREVFGDLIGKKYLSNFLVINAYPLITITRKPTEAYYGNLAARKRLRGLDKALNKLGGLGYSNIGGYHSHIYYRKSATIKNGLSACDIDFLKIEMQELKKSNYVEIVMKIKPKTYTRPPKTGKSIIRYRKKLRVILKIDPSKGYDIILSAYKLTKGKKIKELKIVKGKI